jgi:hypothetical protein
MNAQIGNEAAQFHFCYFLFQIFGAVQAALFTEGHTKKTCLVCILDSLWHIPPPFPQLFIAFIQARYAI